METASVKEALKILKECCIAFRAFLLPFNQERPFSIVLFWGLMAHGPFSEQKVISWDECEMLNNFGGLFRPYLTDSPHSYWGFGSDKELRDGVGFRNAVSGLPNLYGRTITAILFFKPEPELTSLIALALEEGKGKIVEDLTTRPMEFRFE